MTARRTTTLAPVDLDDTDRLYNRAQVCELLGGMSKSAFYRLVQDGELPAVTVGNGDGLIRVRASDLAEYMRGLPRVPTARRSS